MIGNMRHRVGLYTPETTADDLGGTVTSWTFVRALWAGIRPKALTETRENGRLAVTQSYLVAVRYRPSFPERARLVWQGRILRVIAASDPDTRGERLHLICEEESQ